MTNLWQQFRDFAFKGNLIDLAVAVVIGGAFGKVVDSLVKDIIMPLISYLAPAGQTYEKWTLGNLTVGSFLGAIINFLIVAFTLFLILKKVVGAVLVAKAEPVAVTTKDCPFCCSSIPLAAIRCAHCTSQLDAAAAVG